MILISNRVSIGMRKYLESRYAETFLLPPNPNLPENISFHTDLSCFYGSRTLICSPYLENYLQGRLPCPVACGGKEPSAGYLNEIAYNAAAVGKFLFCHEKYTDMAIINLAKKNHLTILATKQGYAKCSIAVVNGNAIITADPDIANRAAAAGIRTLITTNTGVCLPGYTNGFLGGASVKINNTLFFTGNLKKHRDFHKIMAFCEQENTGVDFYEKEPLFDFGSPIYF